MGSARRLTGHVTICCLSINGGFSRGGNILCARRLQDFLGTLDLLTRVAMHGEENSALLQLAFISLCYELGAPGAEQGVGGAAPCSPRARPRPPCHDRTRGEEWAEA